jgi:hypothetical protein
VRDAEKIGFFAGLDELRRLRDSVARQAPVKCTSCDAGWHAPWWGKSTAPVSHLTAEQLARR